jgi:ParB family transcriptional regulator, chromosome partitioning protein
LNTNGKDGIDMVKKALGRGLDALIPETITVREREIIEVEISRIKPGRYQPRFEFDEEKQKELIESIKEKGVVQPIIVRQSNGEFELIAGERRLRAVKMLGWLKVPALIKNVDDEQALELALVENIQRENLNAIEEAKAYSKLSSEFSLTQDDIAKKVGRNRVTVTNTIRLLKLPVEIQDDISAGKISAGHAKVILMVEGIQFQKKLRDLIISNDLSVRETERYAGRIKTPLVHRQKIGLRKSPDLIKIEEMLRSTLGTQVRIVPGKRKGKIEIEYYSQDDLERILEVILKQLAE